MNPTHLERSALERIDAEDMYGAVQGLPEHLRKGRQLALQADTGRWPGTGCAGLVVAGMGGSAIAGDVLRALAAGHARFPITVARSYTLPSWVGPETAVIASSYSGNTEETLSALDDALARGARVLTMSTGGALANRAQEAGLNLVRLPKGIQPRAALPYSLAGLLTVCESLGVTRIPESDWDEAVAVTEEQREEYADYNSSTNRALHLAHVLHGQIPVIYSSEQIECINLRWRNQIHENAKTFAVGNVLPEMNHNEIMGWDRRGAELAQLAVIELRDAEDHARTQKRLAITRKILQPHAHSWHTISSVGSSRLARLLSLLYLSDWVSLYLAILNEVDPSPVGMIEDLKQALAKD